LKTKSFFRLETELNKNGWQLSEVKELYYRAHLQSVFNQHEQSLQTIDRLFSEHKESLNDSLIANLLTIKFNNHILHFDYEPAAEALHTVIELYSHAMDSEDMKHMKRLYPLYEFLKTVPPQKIHQTTDVIIPAKKNEFNHITMQVGCNGIFEDFIFDTGAGYSYISESVAKKMNIKPSENSVQMIVFSGDYVSMKFGIADSLRINGLLFENVVFLIYPDEVFDFASGIIGFFLMHQMKEVKIVKSENIFIPQTPVKHSFRNLYLFDSGHVVQLESDQDTLLLIMDTGCPTSFFTKSYFDKHRERIDEKGIRKTSDTYELIDVPFKIGNYQMTLPKILVHTSEYHFSKDLDGILGQDVLMNFDEMILNFESMCLTFSDKKE
jgi:predicted aspartyl protease